MTAYYNENNPYAAQWLRNLIEAGHIARGHVDERSIADVRENDLAGYTQAHFFAGIGGWSFALRLAGWPDDRPVWTGSCPCQPFSAAGAGKAADDERHLWPAWLPLIAERRPPIVFGEQVEAAIGWGWLDAVFADLEAEGYACGATVLPACGIGAPHIRQRCWFVGLATGTGSSPEPQGRLHGRLSAGLGEPSETRELADADQGGWRGRTEAERRETRGDVTRSGNGLGNPDEPRSQGRRIDIGEHADQRSAWAASDWLPCTDGKARPVEPGTFPLAHGIPGRVGRLRAYGNAVVPQVAAEFIKSCSLTSAKDAP